eukprot:749742-Hanusia_phi.AAC.6
MVAETAPLLSPAQREARPFWNKSAGTRNLDAKQAERYARDAVVSEERKVGVSFVSRCLLGGEGTTPVNSDISQVRDESGDLYALGTPLAR